jgi:hypothetical protein
MSQKLYKNKILISIGLGLMLSLSSVAQDITYNEFGKGIKIHAKDSSFSMKFSTRFQTLYTGVLNTETDEWTDALLIRRARLKFEGHAYSPKLTYKIELGLTNRDIGGIVPQTNNAPNIILDAVLKYQFSPGWSVWFGQTKLPGNRERVISSQKLQFVDRSLVNSLFNIDRDIGVQLHHKGKLGTGVFKQAFSISKGEGRNVIINNSGGYDYTVRVEYLPFGEFASKGDYFGADLKREETPKLSIGATYDYNQGASRQRGQLGLFVIDEFGDQVTNDLSTVFIDAMFKYKGWSIASEFATKASKENKDAQFNYTTGDGFVIQSGYLFKNNFELAGRFTTVKPDDLNYSSIVEQNEFTLGVSKYFVEHSLKIQSDISYRQLDDINGEIIPDLIRFRFQMELSF